MLDVRRARISHALVLAVAACSLNDLSTEFGKGDAGQGDASPTSAADGSTSADAAVEAGSFCDGVVGAALCADFDRGPSLDIFDDRTVLNGATMTVDDADSRSAPASLLVRASDQDTQSPIAFVWKRVANIDKTKASVAFALRFDDVTGKTERAPAATLSLEVPTGLSQVRFIVAPKPYISELHLDKSGNVLAGYEHQLSPPFETGKWVDVEMTLTMGTMGHVRVTLANVVAVDTDLADGPWNPAPVTLNLGLEYAVTPTRAFAVRFDNVVFAVQ